jgi:hypothetical protein
MASPRKLRIEQDSIYKSFSVLAECLVQTRSPPIIYAVDTPALKKGVGTSVFSEPISVLKPAQRAFKHPVNTTSKLHGGIHSVWKQWEWPSANGAESVGCR